MRGDPLACERRAAFLGRADMPAQDVFESGTGHALVPCIEEQFWNQRVAPDRQPSSQCRGSFLPQWKAAFLPALPMNQNGSLRLEGYIIDVEPDQFGDSQASGEAKMQHCAIPDAVPASWVRSVQNELHLLSREVSSRLRSCGMPAGRRLCQIVSFAVAPMILK